MSAAIAMKPSMAQAGRVPDVIHAAAISHRYEGPAGWINSLQGFDLRIPHGEFLCILGPSGCGKSTFLKIVAGLAQPTSGQVLLNGSPIKGPGVDRGIVFQEHALFAWLTVIKNVEFGLKMSGWTKASARERAMHVLDIVGLAQQAHLYPYQLSGGMKHRVAVARAWALTDAALLLMDEPFSAIDAINRMSLQDHLIKTWLIEPRTVLYVTHDIDEAVYLADRVAILKSSPGRVAKEITISLPRPRDRNAPEFARERARITEEMFRLSLL
jgi:NitT/TauT family transport system ATP-binding protein